jgi:o-succinylbenzoate synthase
MKFQIYQYRLPFIEPFVTSGDTYSERKGLLLFYEDQLSGTVAEASPLPGYSEETFDQVWDSLLPMQKELGSYLSNDFTLDSLSYYISTLELQPSLLYAISVLGLSLISDRKKCTVSQLLGYNRSSKLSVNTVLGLKSYENAKSSVKEMYAKGYRTFKIKAGDDFDLLCQLISHISNEYEDIYFRIDANQSWSTETTIKNLKSLEKFPIEYVEEPIDCTQTDQVEKIISETTIPLALDESLLRHGRPASLVTSGLFKFVVVKPTLFGSVFHLIETIASHTHLDYSIVLTTALESGVARNNIAYLASFLGSDSHAHGLSTGSMLKDDLIFENRLLESEIETKKLHWSCKTNDIDKNFISLIESYEA